MAEVAKTVASLDALPSTSFAPEGSETFAARLSRIGPLIGLSRLGCMLTVVPPGKRAFPYHNHHGAEELFVILEGRGTYRIGAERIEVAAGDVCGAPAGDRATAHQLINTGAEPLKYLAISTQADPEVVEYPDSGKYAAIAVGAGRSFFEAHVRAIGRAEDGLDYWDGEEPARTGPGDDAPA